MGDILGAIAGASKMIQNQVAAATHPPLLCSTLPPPTASDLRWNNTNWHRPGTAQLRPSRLSNSLHPSVCLLVASSSPYETP